MVKKTLSVIGAILLLGSAFGVATALDKKYDQQNQVKVLELRLEYKILQDRRENIQEQIWSICDRWSQKFEESTGEFPETQEELEQFMPEEIRDMYRALKIKLKELDEELLKLSKVKE